MREKQIVEARVREMLHRFTKMGGEPWHVLAHAEFPELVEGATHMRRALIELAEGGYVRLTSWSNALSREADYREFPSLDAFFFNRDDCNYVRVKPLIAF